LPGAGRLAVTELLFPAANLLQGCLDLPELGCDPGNLGQQRLIGGCSSQGLGKCGLVGQGRCQAGLLMFELLAGFFNLDGLLFDLVFQPLNRRGVGFYVPVVLPRA